MKFRNNIFSKLIHKHYSFLLIPAVSFFLLALNLSEDNNAGSKIISPEWNQYQTVSRQDTGTVGVPMDFGPGITLTVAEIMEREAMLPEARYKTPKERPIERKEFEESKEATENLVQNPDAPPVSQWPPRNPDEKYQEPLQTDAPQTLGTTFVGPVLSTAGYIPPDSQGDVGPTQVMVTSNGRITVYSKAGVVGGLNVGLDAFFSSVDNGTGTSDPHIRYDRLTQRWYVVGINLPGSGANRIMIARSSGPTITNSSSFTFFQFQQDAVGTPGADAGAFADYPTLGVDKFALYIGANMFQNVSPYAYLGTSVWVVNKTNLNAGSLTVSGFHQISNGSTEGPRTPQGVDNDDPSATEGYFIGVSNFAYSRLTIRRVTNPGTTPVLSGNLNITVPTTTSSQSVPCNGSTANLDGLDDRLFAAAIHRNKISNTVTLWTAHNFEVNSSGVASTSGNRLASRWYEVTNLTTTPSLSQSGTIFDPAASNILNYWIPSCAMSGQGHMAIAYSRAGTANKAEIYASGRLRTDALGTTQANLLLQSSSTNYNVESGTQRWGDYSQTVVDPTDDMTFWTFQEYCNANNSWGVRAVQLKAPPPATPSSSSLVNIDAGQTSVNIVITGTSASGSEFYDPGADAGGPGFANHIAASITGGVTVNSITFNSPTQVTLNINTVSATVGAKNITITNPDGQTATGNSLINIQAHNPSSYTFNALIQGFYDATANIMVRDTMRVYVRNSTSPYALVDSGKVYLSNTGAGVISFTRVFNSVTYYFVFNHRNTIETWSKSPGQSFNSYALSYDLTTAAAQAYGNNIKQVDISPVKFACYNGDVDQDQSVDASDLSDVENASTVSLSGYVRQDCNGDDYVDAADVSLVENNVAASVATVKP
ncbi:MAG: hypothetical protein JNJ56_12040 [Ignavibacteria bacterium]|nr:hypothetical protein [Ignavibacteria bacterium]